jgi:uncharacterized protein (DUF983 family)
MEIQSFDAGLQEPPRDKWQAMKRGFMGRCPRCGEGHMFRAFLKVRDRCEVCGEELHHHRADDAPPYVTLLIVSHVFGFIYVGIMSAWTLPLAVEIVLWPTLVLVLCLLLLPRVKGALIALQWALRMHGFAGEPDGLPEDSSTAARPA